MPSSFTSNLGITKPANGEEDGSWGGLVNTNMDILDRAINGSLALSLSGTSSTLTTTNGSLTDGQYKLLVLGGTPSGTHTITVSPNSAQKIYFVRNTTAQSVVFTQGSGGNVTVATGDSAIIYTSGAGAGAAVVNLTNDFAMSSVKITGGSVDGTAVGATTASTGRFTSVASDSLINTANTRGPTFTKGYVETVFALTGTTPALNPANGSIQTWTLTANSTPTDSVAAGESITLMIDDGTAYTITWPSVTWKTNAGVAPTLNLTGFTAIVLWKVGSVLYGARVGDA